MNPLRQPANAPAASAITIARSTIVREHMRGYALAGSRKAWEGIKLDDVSKGYDRRAFLKVMGLGASAAALAACGGGAGTATTSAPAGTQAVATTAAAVKPTGTITVYSALNETTNNQFSAAFKAAYPGSNIDLLPLAAAGDLQTRIRAEKASPKADIFIGGSSEFHDPLGKEGLLEKYVSPNAAVLKPSSRTRTASGPAGTQASSASSGTPTAEQRGRGQEARDLG